MPRRKRRYGPISRRRNVALPITRKCVLTKRHVDRSIERSGSSGVLRSPGEPKIPCPDTAPAIARIQASRAAPGWLSLRTRSGSRQPPDRRLLPRGTRRSAGPSRAGAPCRRKRHSAVWPRQLLLRMEAVAQKPRESGASIGRGTTLTSPTAEPPFNGTAPAKSRRSRVTVPPSRERTLFACLCDSLHGKRQCASDGGDSRSRDPYPGRRDDRRRRQPLGRSNSGCCCRLVGVSRPRWSSVLVAFLPFVLTCLWLSLSEDIPDEPRTSTDVAWTLAISAMVAAFFALACALGVVSGRVGGRRRAGRSQA